VVVATLLFISFFSFVGLGIVSQGATAPNLGQATSYAVLAGATMTSTGATSIIGNLGVSPGTTCTGLQAPCLGPHTGHVSGTINLAGAAAGAVADEHTAFLNLQGQTGCTVLTGDLGGKNLVPGCYTYSSSAQLTGRLTLSGTGVWVFQIGSTLTTASASSVVMAGGGNACNVFWEVGISATIGTTTTFRGNILAGTSITINTGASIVGRALAGAFVTSGAVTMDDNHIGFQACGSAVTTTTVVPTTSTTIIPTTSFTTITTTIISPSTTATITTTSSTVSTITSTIPTSTTVTITTTIRTSHSTSTSHTTSTTSCRSTTTRGGGGADAICTTSKTTTRTTTKTTTKTTTIGDGGTA